MAMVELASRGEGGPVPLAAVAERQEIPLPYLEQIFAGLRRAGVVASARGPGGGYRLAKPAAETRISEIIAAAEESTTMTRCAGSSDGCLSPKTRCLTHDLWEGLGAHIEAYFAAISLEDVCARRIAAKSLPLSNL